MTDEQIIQALEYCSKPPSECCCNDCPININSINCVEKLCTLALDLINRQKQEILDLNVFYNQRCRYCIDEDRLKISKEVIR